MISIYSFYLVILFCACLISLSLSFYLWKIFWKRKKVVPARTLALMMFAVSFWALSCALALKSGTLEGTYFWERIKYIGLLFVPLIWFIFSLQWTGHTRRISRRFWVFLIGSPIFLLGLVLSDPLHHLVWTEFEPITLGPYLFDRVVHGPAWWLLWVFSSFLIIAGLALFINAIISLSRTYAKQARILLLGVLLPWITNAFFALDISPLMIDITPAVFIFSCLIYIEGFKRFRMIDIIPVAREKIFDQMNNPVFVLDLEDRILDMNQAGAGLTAGKGESMLGSRIQSTLFKELGITEKIPRIEKLLTEIRVGTGSKERNFEVQIDSLSRNGGQPSGHSFILHDVTERKKIENKLQAALNEKDILLKEVHHRVKNNMQIVVSLLRLQSTQIDDENLKKLFRSSENRIRTMALIHERLYKTENFTEIDFSQFIDSLVSQMQRLHCREKNPIQMELTLDPVKIGITKAVPCGLIFQEILSNSFRHAFPGDREGKIQVTLHSGQNGSVEFSVDDNGIGIPESFDIENSESLGLQLIVDLVRQVDGILQIKRENGTHFHITFARE